MALRSSSLEWSPLLGNLGAEVALDLTAPLTEDTRRELSALFDEKQVLVFRNQEIALEQQIALATSFSALVDDPPVDYSPAVVPGVGRYVTNIPGETNARGGELMFHTEFGFLDPPIYGLSLWAEAMPSGGGPATLFVSCYDAYRALPDSLRKRISGLQARHVRQAYTVARLARDGDVPAGSVMSVAPLLYTHPRTGEETLFFSQLWTHSIVGMPLQESAELLAEIEAAVLSLVPVYRHQWALHDLVIWDNIKLLHAREGVEVGGSPRRLRRVAIGDPGRYVGYQPQVAV